MIHEMVSTHAASGLFKGTSGFCPVAATKGMPNELIQLLAEFGSRHYQSASSGTGGGRDMYCHLPFDLKGRRFHLVSRGIQTVDEDPVKRKYVVHQLLLESVRDVPAGPAWLLANDQVWINEWNIAPQYLEARQVQSSALSPRICETWARIVGDAGWAGAALDAWQRRKPFVLIIPPDKPTRPIIDMLVEAQSLIEPRLRWEIPISVSSWYPAKKRQRIWVVYTAGSQEAIHSFRASDRVTVDITRKLEPAANTFSEIARAGAWARFTEFDAKATAKGQTSSHAPSPLFEGTDSLIEDGLLAPLERSAQSQRLGESLTTAKGRSNWKAPKSKVNFRRAVPWIKRGLVAVFLVLLGYGIWKGSYFLRSVASVVDDAIQSQTKELGINEKLAAGDEATKSDPDSLNTDGSDKNVAGNSATRSPDSDEETQGTAAHLVGLKSSETPTLTATTGQRLLNQLREECPFLEFPVEVSDAGFLAFSMSGSESLLGALGVGIATPHQSLPFERSPDGKAWSLHREPSENAGSLHANFSTAIVANENGSEIQFTWNWHTPPDAALAAEIKSGALVVWLLADPTISAAIPLTPPTAGKPTSILDAMYDGITFQPHLSPELFRAETAGRIKWFAEPIGFANVKLAATDSAESAEDLWVVFNSANNMSLLRMNSRKLQQEIEATFPGNPKEKEGQKEGQAADALQLLIDRTAPIQLEVRMDPPSYVDAKSETMITRAKTILFMKGDDGSTCSLIFQHQPRPGEKSRKQDFEDGLKVALIRWLAVNLNLDVPWVEAMTKGKSFSPKPAATAEVRAKAAFAQKLVEVILRELDEEFEFRAVRSTTLHSEIGEFDLPISAYQGK